jgi:hypothetical protein
MHADQHLSRAEVQALVELHTGRIARTVPEARISVSGSTLLDQEGGSRDIDLVVLVPHVGQAAEQLRSAYAPLEDEWRENWAAFRHDGSPQVDVAVTSPGTKGDDHHRRAWELILDDPRLQAEYKSLKAAGIDADERALVARREPESAVQSRHRRRPAVDARASRGEA